MATAPPALSKKDKEKKEKDKNKKHASSDEALSPRSFSPSSSGSSGSMSSASSTAHHSRNSSLSVEPKIRVWLKIQGSKFLNWKRRYVVIDDDKLRWWKSEKDQALKEVTECGRIPLKGATVHLRHLKNAFGIAVRHTFTIDAPVAEISSGGSRRREVNKSFHFAADSDGERDSLVSKISTRLGMQTSRILVTGATGTVGRLVLEALSKRLYVQVLAGVRDLKAPLPQYVNVTPIEFDYAKPDVMAQALKGVDRVFFLNKLGPEMVPHARAFLEAAKNARKLQQIVRVSCAGADVADFEIGKWHHEVEAELAKCGKNVTVLRPSSFCQNFGNFWAKHIKTRDGFESPIPDAKIAYVDVKDVADVAAEILTRPVANFAGQSIDITGPEALTHRDVVSILTSVLGKPIVYKECDTASFKKGLEVLNGFTPEVSQAVVQNYMQNFAAQKRSSVSGAMSVQRILSRRATTFAEYAKRQATDFIVAKLTILITTSGNIGLAVLRSILSMKLPASALLVRVAVRRPEKAHLVESLGAEAVMVDVNSPSSLAAALSGVDRLLLIPPFAVDLGKFCNAWIDAARLKHTGFILKSTVINTALRQTEFAIQHDESDKHLIASGIPYTFVRPTLLMSAPANQTANVLATGKLYQGWGPAKISLVDPRDVGDVYSKIALSTSLAEYIGKGFDVTGGVAMSYYDCATVFSKVLNRPVEFVELSEQRMLQGLTASGMSQEMAVGMTHIARSMKNGDFASVSDTVQTLLGRPPISFEGHLRFRLLHKDFEAISRVDSRYLPVARNTVLVTAGTGNVGLYTVRALLTLVAGWQVRATVHSRGVHQVHDLQALGAEICPINFSDHATLVSAARGARKAVLMIPLVEEYVTHARAWAQALKDSGTIKLIIYISPARLGGQFSEWAREVEAHLASLQLQFVSVKPAPLMHNIFRLWGDSIRQQHTIYAPLANVVIPWLDPRDLGEAVAHVTVAPSEEWAGKTVVVHAAQYLNADELAAEVSKATGSPLRIVSCTKEEARNHLPADLRREVLSHAWAAVLEEWTDKREKEENQIEKILGRKPGGLAEYLTEELRGAAHL